MKIALLITGQIRTNELCKHVIKNTLIKKYDTDVFLSIDKSNKNQNDDLNSINDTQHDTINEVIKYYNPISTYICETYDNLFDNEKKKLDCNLPIDRRYRLILQQYYVVSKAYEMLKNHIKNTGKQYDIIIRLRFDQFIWSNPSPLSKYVIYNSRNCKVIKYNTDIINMVKKDSEHLKIELDHPNENEIYVFGFSRNNIQSDYVNDQFWVHSYSLINIISEFYNELPYLINTHYFNAKDYAFCEILFYRFLKSKNINIKKSNVIGEFCREFFI